MRKTGSKSLTKNIQSTRRETCPSTISPAKSLNFDLLGIEPLRPQ